MRLKRAGAGPHFKGLCPFHSEKTPSFNVHSAQQFYKCFGCEAGGDLFKFVMQIEGVTFPEALKLLAERYGIPMPERQRYDDPIAQRREALLEMHEVAAEQFQKTLRAPQGLEARQYLESRGVSQAAVDEFRLGLSDASGQQLVGRLQKYGPALMEESGLVSKRNDGSGFFDRFRGRLMFPIHNESGKVIAFGGRALRAGDEPKYLNSPSQDESPVRIYKKSEVLYNLHRAKIDARKHDRMILVEGYMDVIGVYSAGIHEVVASCGTALSMDQVRAIKRQISQQQSGAGQIIVNFDPDPAGARSTEKYISVMLAEGLRVKVLSLAGGLDPDEFIKQNGAAAYEQCLNKATSYFHWLAERARDKFDMRSAEGRVDAFKFIWPSIQQVNDRVERSAISNEIAEYLKVDRDVIREHFRRAPRPEQTERTRPAPAAGSVPPNERLLLTCMLLNSDARQAVKHFLRQSDLVHALETREVFEAVLAMDEEDVAFSLDALLSRVEPRLQRVLTMLSFGEVGIREEDAPQQTLQCLKALEAKAMAGRRLALKRKIRELEQLGNLQEAIQLIHELNHLDRPTLGC